jgi:HAD superfamily hydrolase (TIGR02253 family)
MRVEALLFDFDGTLLDSAAGNRDALAATCREVGARFSSLDAHQLLEANAEAWLRYWPEVEQGWALGKIDDADLSREVWRRALRACGCDDAAVARAACETYFRIRSRSLRLFPEVPEVLRQLQREYSLALVTNGASETQRQTLRQLGIEKAFDAVAISGELGVAKPNPPIFEAVLRELNVKPQQAWHIGDDPVRDIEGARRTGLTTVWLNRDRSQWSKGEPAPHHEITSLSELAELLPVSTST